MAFPTAVNSQITDSVSNLPTYDGASAILFGEIIKAIGKASQNGMSEKHQAEVIRLAALISGINTSLD